MARPKGPRTLSVGLRISEELDTRLGVCAEKVRSSKNHLLALGAEAVADAIEEQHWEVVLPIKFEVKSVPVEKR